MTQKYKHAKAKSPSSLEPDIERVHIDAGHSEGITNPPTLIDGLTEEDQARINEFLEYEYSSKTVTDSTREKAQYTAPGISEEESRDDTASGALCDTNLDPVSTAPDAYASTSQPVRGQFQGTPADTPFEMSTIDPGLQEPGSSVIIPDQGPICLSLSPVVQYGTVQHSHDSMASLDNYRASLPRELEPSDRAILEASFIVTSLGATPTGNPTLGYNKTGKHDVIHQMRPPTGHTYSGTFNNTPWMAHRPHPGLHENFGKGIQGYHGQISRMMPPPSLAVPHMAAGPQAAHLGQGPDGARMTAANYVPQMISGRLYEPGCGLMGNGVHNEIGTQLDGAISRGSYSSTTNYPGVNAPLAYHRTSQGYMGRNLLAGHQTNHPSQMCMFPPGYSHSTGIAKEAPDFSAADKEAYRRYRGLNPMRAGYPGQHHQPYEEEGLASGREYLSYGSKTTGHDPSDASLSH